MISIYFDLFCYIIAAVVTAIERIKVKIETLEKMKILLLNCVC